MIESKLAEKKTYKKPSIMTFDELTDECCPHVGNCLKVHIQGTPECPMYMFS